jgi:formate dehydrogenase major subunit
MSRNVPWLLELQPRQFVEMSPQLAKEKSIKSGDTVVIASARGSIEAVAIVTPRMRPFTVAGRQIHEVGLPYCFGWTTKGAGDSANLLTASVGDANTMIPETKAFMVGVNRKG